MTKTLLCVFLSVATVALAQNDVPIKATPAAHKLSEIAKIQIAQKKTLDASLQAARTALSQKVEPLSKELVAEQKSMNDQLSNDKHYKPIIDKISDLQKQISQMSGDANSAYEKQYAAQWTEEQAGESEMRTLESVVREENNLPDTATFDATTDKWTVPAPPKQPEKK